MADFDFKNTKFDDNGNISVDTTKPTIKSSSFAGKVYLYAFIGLLISAVVCVGVSALLNQFGGTGFSTAYSVVLLLSAPGVLIISIIMMIKMRNAEKKATPGTWVMYIIYTICFGLMLTPFAIILDFYTMAIALGLTALCFGSMALVGHFSKKDMSIYGMVGMGMLVGVCLVSLFIPLFMLIPGTTKAAWWVNIIVCGVSVLAMMFIALFDANSIKQISLSCAVDGNSNLALLCALNIYTDIITMLIRILYLILLIAKNK